MELKHSQSCEKLRQLCGKLLLCETEELKMEAEGSALYQKGD